MTIQSHPNSLDDILIYSDVKLTIKKKDDTTLTSTTSKKAFAELEQSFKDQKSFDDYKKKLNFTYGRFLKGIEQNLSTLTGSDLTPEVKNAVSKKLELLAEDHIQKKESKFSTLHKFIHIIGQAIQGHGFQTKGEWGKKLASRIQVEIEKEPFEIFETIFLFKETLVGNNKKTKLILYEQLDANSRKNFHKKLLDRKDWYDQAFDLTEGADEVFIKEFITDAMVDKFLDDSDNLIHKYEDERYFNANFQYALIQRALQKCLKKNDFTTIANLRTQSAASLKNMVDAIPILTASEFTAIDNHFKKI